jgi:CHC2-type zinc finger protein
VSDIADAKERLPLPALLHRLGLGKHAKKSARCPFHDDKHNSFSVWKNGESLWFWKCHAGCGEGDEITFLELHEKVSQRDAIKRFLEMASVNGATPPGKAALTSTSKPTLALDWQACVEAFTNKHVEWITKWRGYSIEFCCWLKGKGLVGLYNGCIAFPLHDRAGNIVACHYRLKDGSWRYYPDCQR